MRISNIGNVSVEYPEQIVWKQDSTAVRVYGVQNIGAQITIWNPMQEFYVLEYYSDQNDLLFYLDDAIKALWDHNIGQWYCKVSAFSGSASAGTDLNFNFNVLDGKSFTSRSHGISSVIYVYSAEELHKLQVFSPQSGIATCGGYSSYVQYGLNQFMLDGVITTDGEYQLCLRDSAQVPPAAYITGDDAKSPYVSAITFNVLSSPVNYTIGGDVFAENKVIFPVCHNIIFADHCEDFDFGEIAYTDLDGMRRYLGGKVLEDTDDVKTESYFTSNTEVYDRVPNRYIISHEKVIKLIISDIHCDAYPHDLLYSQELEFRTWFGGWRSCSLKTSKFTRKDEELYDIELEIIISQ